MKVLRYPDIQDLHRDQRRLIENDYDDWNLVTGRVGKGKSTWAMKNAIKLDRTFTVQSIPERIHWDEESFWTQYVKLQPGQCIILDEFEGHRRAAMHGERLTFLGRMKRIRSRRVHVFIVFDRVSSLDRDLLTDRNAYWHHLEQKGTALVRKPDTRLTFKLDSTPIEPTTYPIVGDFDFTPFLPAGFKEAYERRKAIATEAFLAGEKPDNEPAQLPPRPKTYGRIDMILAEIAQRELSKPG